MFGDSPEKKTDSASATAPASPVSPIEEVIEDIRQGRMVILMDDEDRENEGDIVVAAEKVTTEQVNFMLKHARGLICVPLVEQRLAALGIRMMVSENTAPLGTAFTVSMDASDCHGPGVSAADRALTIRRLVDDKAASDDFVTPGHIFPLRAREGGVLVRTGQTEGSVDLCRLAGLAPAGVICEILNPDGTMARMPDLVRFAKEHGLRISTVADVIQYRLQNESLVSRVATARLPTKEGGEFTAHVYTTEVEEGEHVALVKGTIDPTKPVLVRAHAEYLPGDAFAYSQRDTGAVLRGAMKRIAEEGEGVILYVRRHRRGVEMLAEDGPDGLPTTNPNARLANFKDYGIGAQILRDLGVRKIRLLTNSPFRLPNLAGYGLEVVEVLPV
jgi:3,4-dihydroxy 2-butanone 4-phosphate synthase/GTP cyclohydrolase II